MIQIVLVILRGGFTRYCISEEYGLIPSICTSFWMSSNVFDSPGEGGRGVSMGRGSKYPRSSESETIDGSG